MFDVMVLKDEIFYDKQIIIAIAFGIILFTPIVISCRIPRILLCYVSRLKIYHALRSSSAVDTVGKVSGLYIYPVKSLRGVSLESSRLDTLGLLHDRRFMVVRPSASPSSSDEPTHQFLTQRQAPSLATISAHASKDTLTLSHQVDGARKHLTISLWDDRTKKKHLARIWGEVVAVRDAGDEAANFVRNVVLRDDELFRDVRVVSIRADAVRHADDLYVPAAALRGGDLPRVALQDGFPVLISCEKSLQDLNERLVKKGKPCMDMDRFRPNIVITGTEVAVDEDTWKVIQIGSNIFHLVKGCPRCKQSCTDQKTGRQSEEPLITLAEYRKAGTGGVYFGQNAILQSPSGIVNVGDQVRVLSRGDPVWDLHHVESE